MKPEYNNVCLFIQNKNTKFSVTRQETKDCKWSRIGTTAEEYGCNVEWITPRPSLQSGESNGTSACTGLHNVRRGMSQCLISAFAQFLRQEWIELRPKIGGRPKIYGTR